MRFPDVYLPQWWKDDRAFRIRDEYTSSKTLFTTIPGDESTAK